MPPRMIIENTLIERPRMSSGESDCKSTFELPANDKTARPMNTSTGKATAKTWTQPSTIVPADIRTALKNQMKPRPFCTIAVSSEPAIAPQPLAASNRPSPRASTCTTCAA
jgi:hypothetical protein